MSSCDFSSSFNVCHIPSATFVSLAFSFSLICLGALGNPTSSDDEETAGAVAMRDELRRLLRRVAVGEVLRRFGVLSRRR